jgi:hypothetical protein
MRGHFVVVRSQGHPRRQLGTIEVQGLGDTASELGASEAVGDYGAVKGRGKYIVVW